MKPWSAGAVLPLFRAEASLRNLRKTKKSGEIFKCLWLNFRLFITGFDSLEIKNAYYIKRPGYDPYTD
jgi:hypothetical protein